MKRQIITALLAMAGILVMAQEGLETLSGTVLDRDSKKPLPQVNVSIDGEGTFGQRDSFYDKASYFDDPDFWADYNIIEPSESLETAMDKLKKNALTK